MLEILKLLFNDSPIVACAIVNDIGTIVYANDHYNKALRSNEWINPTMDQLLKEKKEGVFFSGYATIGNLDTFNHSYSCKALYFESQIVIVLTKDDQNTDDVLQKVLFENQKNTNLHRQLIKEKKIIQQQLLEIASLNNEKSRFLGIAAHDLRNPIGSIFSFADLMLDFNDIRNSEKLLKYAVLIRERSRFSLNLLNDLLDVSKIESGTYDCKFSICNIKDFMHHLIELMEPLAQRKNIKVLNEISIKHDTMLVDVPKLEQIITNLLSNAIKFSPLNSTILVKIEEKQRDLNFIIEDEGPGVPSEAIDSIFSPFGLRPNQPTNGEDSTGLGLSITKKLVQLHGGTIGVSNREKKGSSFYFRIPQKY